MSRSYLDKENQHILTHTKDNRVNSFIANVNELVRHVDDIFYANTIFNQDVVDALREALDTDFTELLKDLKKGNYLGNRQLDINLLKNMDKWNEYLTEEEQKNIWLDENELVYYDSALVKFIDGTTHRIVFQFDGIEGSITTHGDLLLQLNNDEEFLAKLEKTSANTFPAKVVGEYLKLYDELGQNSNVEGVELNAVSGKYKEKNPYYYWIATTSALQVLAMRSTEIIKLGVHIDKVVSLALNVDQMLELQNRLPQLVDTYDEEGNPKGDVTIYNHLTELLEIYSKLDYLLDVVNLAEAAENNANMAEQFADEALTRLNKIQSIKVGRTITTTPNNEAVVFYNSDSNEFTFTVPKGEKGDRGDPFQVKASGTMEQRALYDDRPKGFSFLCIDTSEVFFRKSDTHADWTVGVPFGKGDKGDKGDKGEDGRTPKLSDSIDSASSLTAASSKAIKTVNDKWSAIGTAAMRDVGTEPNEIPTNSVLGSGTAASWSADVVPYPINAQVYHNGKQWLALRENSEEPVEGANWTEVVGKQYIDASISWTSRAIGEEVWLDDSNPAVDVPQTDNPNFRFIKLTAGENGSGGYNEGVLINETVSGSAPLIEATAEVNLPESPFHGQTVRLLNTERRFVRAGEAGVAQEDAFQGHSILARYRSAGGGTSVEYFNDLTGVTPAYVWSNLYGVISAPLWSDGTNGTPRTASETRPRNIGRTVYMRIK